MSTRFREILNTEGITLVELSKATDLSISTIQRLCGGQASVRAVTYGKATRGLNRLATSGTTYVPGEVFPESDRPDNTAGKRKGVKKLRYRK